MEKDMCLRCFDLTNFPTTFPRDRTSNISIIGTPPLLSETAKLAPAPYKGTLIPWRFSHIPEETLEVGREITSLIVPPFNATEEERIAWFWSKLPEFEIFKSDKSARQFHCCVLEYFNKKCEGQFFVTWISPASPMSWNSSTQHRYPISPIASFSLDVQPTSMPQFKSGLFETRVAFSNPIFHAQTHEYWNNGSRVAALVGAKC
ncbi:hypothetical protein ACE6H2_025404 [Prunus campanulata]